jgi:hypothetical protein
MIFSESRFPLFGITLQRRRPLRRSRGVTREVFGTGRRVALVPLLRGGMAPSAASRMLQYSQVRVTTFGRRLS